jgi:Rrf2 family nitric oxide-sensitive transcriptional repressor
LCPLHKRLDHSIALVQETLRSATIADLLAEPTDSTPLCEGPGRGIAEKRSAEC